MQTAKLNWAVEASTFHSGIVTVGVENADDAYVELAAEYDDVDCGRENDGSLGVWGRDCDGQDWRLRLVEG